MKTEGNWREGMLKRVEKGSRNESKKEVEEEEEKVKEGLKREENLQTGWRK